MAVYTWGVTAADVTGKELAGIGVDFDTALVDDAIEEAASQLNRTLARYAGIDSSAITDDDDLQRGKEIVRAGAAAMYYKWRSGQWDKVGPLIGRFKGELADTRDRPMGWNTYSRSTGVGMVESHRNVLGETVTEDNMARQMDPLNKGWGYF